MHFSNLAVATVALLALAADRVEAQHLYWDTRGSADATCVYGEVTVLATHHPIYYCGANWHPGEPAGAIAVSSTTARTSGGRSSRSGTRPRRSTRRSRGPTPRRSITASGARGEGGHTHMLWDWQVGDTFRFFVQKRPGTAPGTTDVHYFVHDRTSKVCAHRHHHQPRWGHKGRGQRDDHRRGWSRLVPGELMSALSSRGQQHAGSQTDCRAGFMSPLGRFCRGGPPRGFAASVSSWSNGLVLVTEIPQSRGPSCAEADPHPCASENLRASPRGGIHREPGRGVPVAPRTRSVTCAGGFASGGPTPSVPTTAGPGPCRTRSPRSPATPRWPDVGSIRPGGPS